MGEVIAFTGQTNTVFLPSYEAPPGAKRRRWTVVGVNPDGTRQFQHFRGRDRGEAEWFCNILRKVDADRHDIDRRISADPFFRLLASLAPEMRKATMAILRHCESQEQ